MSAPAIAYLPSASRPPLLQKRKPGRLPKSVVDFGQHRQKALVKANESGLIEDEIYRIQRTLEALEMTRAGMLAQLCALRNPAMDAAQRASLAAQIEWNNLPWQEKQEREALRQHMRQFNSVSSDQ